MNFEENGPGKPDRPNEPDVPSKPSRPRDPGGLHDPGGPHDPGKPDKPENHVTLTVITVDGNWSDIYNKHDTLKKVVDNTVKKLDLLYDLSQYGLFKVGSAEPLVLSLTIEQAGLNDGDEMQLRKLNAGGGENL